MQEEVNEADKIESSLEEIKRLKINYKILCLTYIEMVVKTGILKKVDKYKKTYIKL